MTKKKCRISGDSLIEVVDFGMQPLGNGFVESQSQLQEYFFPMKVGFCEKSKMLQLVEQPEPNRMFHDHYAFYSSTSKHMAKHFEDFSEEVIAAHFFPKSDPFVVELGCNDGILLKHFANRSMRHLGIEPSINVALEANKIGIETISEFFSESIARKIVESHGHADIFVAANVMCHIEEMNSVIAGIKVLLNQTGVAIFEDPYLGDVISKTSYDQIYDEHVFLFSALSVQYMFGLQGMELIDVIPQPTHGGSMRYVVANSGVYPVSNSVTNLLNAEILQGLDKAVTFIEFDARVKKSKADLRALLVELKRNGKKIAGYGATSKSTTILNYSGIGPDLIDYICDTTPIKQGKYTPGTHIPVVPYDKFKDSPPDYAFLFAWNHAEEIMVKETDFIKHGGRWITHVPEVKVL